MSQTEYTRFIILASPRTGTHMLRTSLQGHSQIVVHGELFNPRGLAFFPYTVTETSHNILHDHAFHPYSSPVRAVGFPIHDFSIFNRPNPNWLSVWNELQAIDGLRVIRLGRQNWFRQLVSNIVARVENQWQSFVFYPEPPVRESKKLKLEFARVEGFFLNLEKARTDITRKFERNPLLEVMYEELFSSYDETTRRIQDFLGVEYQPVQPLTRKQGNKTMRETVYNYDELKAQFAGSRWARFFDET